MNAVPAQETGSILKIGFVLSKWPHVHGAYLVSVCNQNFIAVHIFVKTKLFDRNYDDGVCNCVQGNITDSFGSGDNRWCCKTTNDTCTIEQIQSGYNFIEAVTCKGKSISLNDQCSSQEEGHFCNHYPKDEWRNAEEERSYVDICNDNR